MTKGSEVEMRKFVDRIHSFAVVWGEGFDSHAFVFEQILQKLEKSGYAPREEILENWKMFMEDKT